MPKLASKYTCSGCMACKDICPKKAIFKQIGKDGHRYVSVNPSLCIECKLCEKICPVVNGYSYGDNTLESAFYAGWSKDSVLRTNGATTGIFGTLAWDFLNRGGWIAGAVMDGLECNYILSDSYEDIPRLQGSKYTSSDPTAIYSSVLSKLKGGDKVLFSGLPCHVAALLNYIPKILHERLYTVDLICGGVSSPLLIDRFVQNNPDVKSILSFRNKNRGWKPDGYRYSLTFQTKDGKVVSESPEKRNLVTDGFSCELTDRYSCYNCKFSGMHRKSDITIGDLWKDRTFTDQHFNGVSSLIVHSEKGKRLLESANIELSKVSPGQVLVPNHRIYDGRSGKEYLPERRFMGFFFKYLSYESLLKIYASNLRTKNVLWWPFALYRLVSFRFLNWFRQRRDNKLLKEILK